ncbi:MAG TPA: glucokinase [Asticcacaulis sp.]|nr:glucokinase [Asticcacaulis sp.]
MNQVLLSDISNGLYMKLALAPKGERPETTTRYACDSLDEFKSAITDFLQAHGNPTLSGAAISAGGWEEHGVMAMPNHAFRISRSAMREFLEVQRLNLVNDCVAKALAIPHLAEDEKIKVCGGESLDEQVIALISTHRGLGMSGLAPDGMGGYTAMPCEGGHSDLPITSQTEFDVLQWMSRKYKGHVSRERAVSLPGLVDIFTALTEIDKDEIRPMAPEEVIAAAAAGENRALRAINLAMGWLASTASDVALTLGARGGVFLHGELIDMVGDLFDPEAFASRYRDKGRLSRYMTEIPVYRTTAPDIEVIGLATLFD